MATDLHNLLLVVITLISLFVLGLLIYVGVRFRASRNPNPSKTSHHTVIEILVDGYSGADSWLALRFRHSVFFITWTAPTKPTW